MKAKEAPEKIYVPTTGNELHYHMACPNNEFQESIEYIRTDAFIWKALKFLDGSIPDYIELKHANVDTFMDVDNERFIKDFINYIKGE